jgi:hypothetical protein
MTGSRRKFTDEFKREAVELMAKEGLSFVEAGRRLGVHQNLLRNWKQALAAGGSDIGGRRMGTGPAGQGCGFGLCDRDGLLCLGLLLRDLPGGFGSAHRLCVGSRDRVPATGRR